MFGRKKNDFKKEPDSKLYRTLSLGSIIGVFAIVAVVVIAIFGYIDMNSFLFGLLCSIGMLCLGVLLSLPWVKRIEKNEFRKTGIVFVCFIAVCTLLWIISVWMGVNVYQQLKKLANKSMEDEVVVLKSLMATLNFIKVTLVVSLQLMMASIIGTCITRFGKTMLAFQGIAYASYAFLDFYLTFFLCCIQIDDLNLKFEVNDSISLLGNKFMIMLLVISVIFMVISNAVINKSQERKTKEYVNDAYKVAVGDEFGNKVQETPYQSAPTNTQTSVEQKLAQLKDMLDKNIITQEEYNKKREQIINDM